jgi:hypothetical protein
MPPCRSQPTGTPGSSPQLRLLPECSQAGAYAFAPDPDSPGGAFHCCISAAFKPLVSCFHVKPSLGEPRWGAGGKGSYAWSIGLGYKEVGLPPLPSSPSPPGTSQRPPSAAAAAAEARARSPAYGGPADPFFDEEDEGGDLLIGDDEREVGARGPEGPSVFMTQALPANSYLRVRAGLPKALTTIPFSCFSSHLSLLLVLSLNTLHPSHNLHPSLSHTHTPPHTPPTRSPGHLVQ